MSRGFTLLEVLLTLAILSMVATLAIPRLLTMGAIDPLSETTAILTRMVHTAQRLSVTSHLPLRLFITDSPPTLHIQPLPDSQTAATAQTSSSTLLPDNISLTLAHEERGIARTTATTEITITPDGYALPFSGVARDNHGNEKKVSFSAFLLKIPEGVTR